jgi:hypothetical protein
MARYIELTLEQRQQFSKFIAALSSSSRESRVNPKHNYQFTNIDDLPESLANAEKYAEHVYENGSYGELLGIKPYTCNQVAYIAINEDRHPNCSTFDDLMTSLRRKQEVRVQSSEWVGSAQQPVSRFSCLARTGLFNKKNATIAAGIILGPPVLYGLGLTEQLFVISALSLAGDLSKMPSLHYLTKFNATNDQVHSLAQGVVDPKGPLNVGTTIGIAVNSPFVLAGIIWLVYKIVKAIIDYNQKQPTQKYLDSPSREPKTNLSDINFNGGVF